MLQLEDFANIVFWVPTITDIGGILTLKITDILRIKET